MIKTIAQIIYVGIITAIVGSIGVHSVFGDKINLHFPTSTLYLFILLFIPIFEQLFEYIKKDTTSFLPYNSDTFYKIVIITLLVCIFIIGKDFQIGEYLLIASVFWGIFFGTDERYFFLGSLYSLVIVIFFLLSENRELAEFMSIYVYYLLVIGVFISFTNSGLHSHKIIEKNKNTISIQEYLEKKPLYQKCSSLNFEQFLYFFFVAYVVTIPLYLYSESIGGNKQQVILIMTIFLIFWYLLGKLFGKTYTFTKRIKLSKSGIMKWSITASTISLFYSYSYLNVQELSKNFIFFLLLLFFISNFYTIYYIFKKRKC